MTRKSSSFRATVALSLFVLTAIPSSALAWDSDTEPDNVVTVTVDLPATDGSDNGGVCNGYSTITTSVNHLAATLDQVAVGNQNPTIDQRLNFYGNSLSDAFYNSASEWVQVFSDNGDGTYSINQEWASQQSWTANALDTNGDGVISSADSSPLMLDRRSYVTQPFTVQFDADSCVDSYAYGAVWAERTEVEHRVVDQNGYSVWTSAEFNPDDVPDPVAFFQSNPDLNASAYLLRPTRVMDGLVNIPYQLANYTGSCCNPPVTAGDSGSASVRGVMKLFGNADAGQYRVNFGFWLEVNTGDYFYQEFPYWFLPF